MIVSFPKMRLAVLSARGVGQGLAFVESAVGELASFPIDRS